VRTPEEFVDASEADYNRGDYDECVVDATESLKLRPGMPAAWYNISICNVALGYWDAAIAAATEALRIEPESDDVRETLEWAVGEKRRNTSGR
jgi:tetratricopeptide (TPR) repeat protein